MTTERYGRLTLVIKDAGRTGDGHVLSLWRCDCGAETKTAYSRVKTGYSKSCGCMAVEASKNNIKHGNRRGSKSSPAYSSWIAMNTRCNNPASKDYVRYGARGIKICERWRVFENFLADMGPRPDGKTLERIDSMLGYFPGNVKWGDHFEQAQNRTSSLRWEIKGELFESISHAAKHFGVSEQTVHRWVNGAFDERRGTFTEPRSDCKLERKYG